MIFPARPPGQRNTHPCGIKSLKCYVLMQVKSIKKTAATFIHDEWHMGKWRCVGR
jgi:hypothetical protein